MYGKENCDDHRCVSSFLTPHFSILPGHVSLQQLLLLYSFYFCFIVHKFIFFFLGLRAACFISLFWCAAKKNSIRMRIGQLSLKKWGQRRVGSKKININSLRKYCYQLFNNLSCCCLLSRMKMVEVHRYFDRTGQ